LHACLLFGRRVLSSSAEETLEEGDALLHAGLLGQIQISHWAAVGLQQRYEAGAWHRRRDWRHASRRVLAIAETRILRKRFGRQQRSGRVLVGRCSHKCTLAQRLRERCIHHLDMLLVLMLLLTKEASPDSLEPRLHLRASALLALQACCPCARRMSALTQCDVVPPRHCARKDTDRRPDGDVVGVVPPIPHARDSDVRGSAGVRFEGGELNVGRVKRMRHETA